MDPDKHVEVERVESPAPSCVSMDSDCSMEALSHSELDEWITYLGIHEEGLESRPPSCVSMKSVWSMNEPLHFRESWTPEFSKLVSSLLSEDHFRCYVCSEGLREPVSIPCGHSYCGQCISSYWAQPSHAGDYQCPQCSKSFPTQPELSTNIALFRLLQALQQAGFSPVLPAVAHAEAGNVACDICWGPKLRAVKTCVTCSASYCESHVRQHYTVPALQRHTLTRVTEDQEVSLKRQREEEEMEDRGQSPKMRKMQFKEEEVASKGSSDELKKRINKLELENSELKKRDKELELENAELKKRYGELKMKDFELEKRHWELKMMNTELSDIDEKLEQKNAELKNIRSKLGYNTAETKVFKPENLRQTLMATQEDPKRLIRMGPHSLSRASISDNENLPQPALQDLLRTLRLPRSPLQLQRVLDILRSNPQLMAAFLAFRASKYKGGQGPSEAGVAGGGPSPAGRM